MNYTPVKRHLYLFSVVFLFSVQNSYAQELNKIAPATPTTAGLGKYGEVPVSLHTGLPTITVPLAQLNGKDLSLPIELSYHASGVKVEEMASWVGLGWSLFAGGVVTREVRSLPDEDSFGFFTKPKKNSEFLDDYDENVQNALAGVADFEPDVFTFNVGNESGKFIYDEEAEEFVSITKSVKKISYKTEGAWEIILENGTLYYFADRETNLTNSSCSPSAVSTITTGWYLSKIVNNNKTDSILFDYQSCYYSYQTLISSDRFFVAYPSSDCSVAADGFSQTVFTCFRNNSFNTPRLQSIQSRSGKVEFVVDSVERMDVLDDHSLKYIEVYDNKDQLLYAYELRQDYFLPNASGTLPSQYRLKLSGIDKFIGSERELYRNFEYYSTDIPNRLSFAQDFWGYFNNQTGNSHLIPHQIVTTASGPLWVTGANRNPGDADVITHIGMLKKLVYPTGGYTSFEYENHLAVNPFIPTVAPKGFNMDINTGTGTVFDSTFVIDNPPDASNGYNGGAFVDVTVDVPCDYANTFGCAVISITGPTGVTLTGNLDNYYLPNGTYTFTMNFTSNTSDPPNWHEFYGGVFWQEVTNDQATKVGGLRIKKISDFDPETNSIAYQRIYKYHSQTDSLASSAIFDTSPSFQKPLTYRYEKECTGAVCIIPYYCQGLKLTGSSNYPAAGIGGVVNYSFVTVLEDVGGVKGKSTYTFSNLPDPVNDSYPYVPVDLHDWQRGQLLNKSDYRYVNGEYQPAQEVINTYSHHYSDKTTSGIKIGPYWGGGEIIYLNSLSGSTPYTNGNYISADYDFTNSVYAHHYLTTTRTYDTENPSQYTEVVEFDSLDLDQMNVVKKVRTTSNDNTTLVTYIKYPRDYTGTGSDAMSQAIAEMKTKNIINTVVEQSQWRKTSSNDSTLVNASLALHRIDNGKIVKDKVLTLPNTSSFTASTISGNQFIYSSGYKSDLQISKYDAIGNIEEGVAKDGVTMSFIWDTDKLNPIAAVKGAPHNKIFHTSFEDDVTNVDTLQSKTGRKSRSSSYTVNLPSAGTYKLSYWKKVGSGNWQLVETTISSSTAIGGSGILIDEVRVHPKTAQMTTYTFYPGIGVRSVNDPNNIVSYYQYDSFGRLKLIRDENGNILKKYEYHYKNQSAPNTD